jgi:ATP/maltotriose-dependent transcriptional regulator MalT
MTFSSPVANSLGRPPSGTRPRQGGQRVENEPVDLPAGLLATKLRPPAPRPDAVPRPGLVAGLRAGLNGPLVLLAASAGYGKTTLLTQWLAALDPQSASVAWLSLEAGDDDPP